MYMLYVVSEVTAFFSVLGVLLLTNPGHMWRPKVNEIAFTLLRSFHARRPFSTGINQRKPNGECNIRVGDI
jgi:hypothetical protein